MNRAAIYCRISRDPEGVRVGVERQEEDCRALVAREQFEMAGVFVDNDTSASTLSRKARPRYSALLESARVGEVDVVVAYSNSRLTRRPLELEDLIQLHDRHGTRVVTVVSGEDNLSTADGRMVARIKASVDAAEAERAGERIARAHLQKARAGSTNYGARPFGWQPDKATLDPLESALIRQAVTDVMDGVGLKAITRAWNGAGVSTVRGNAWDHRSLRQLLKGPRLAGWRVHQGKVAVGVDGELVKGVWEPILTADEYDRLQVSLTGRPGRSTGRRGARRYLLAGVARCGTCGARMYGSPVPSGHAYTCRGEPTGTPHSVSTSGERTDEAVTAVVTARLAQLGDLGPTQADVPDRDSARLAEIPTKITELMGAYNAGTLSAAVAFGQVEKLEAERSDLSLRRDREIAASARPTRVSAADFEACDTDRQRAVIEEMFEAVVIAPSGKGVRWHPDRITYVWRRDGDV